jgi:flagella basal body P-ring formation protein FlgA
MSCKTALLALLLAALACHASAQMPQRATPEAALKLYLEREATGLPGRVEVSIGALDARVDLSACLRIEPFLPSGARLWGRAMVGLRCTDGPTLSAYFPVQVKVFAPALVATRPLAAGALLGAGDAQVEEVELTREPPGTLSDPAAIADKLLARPVSAGQMLRPEYFRARPVVAAGDHVKLVYAGAGFTVATEGRALAPAAEGQSVRIQTATGRTLTGTARAGRIVQVGY